MGTTVNQPKITMWFGKAVDGATSCRPGAPEGVVYPHRIYADLQEVVRKAPRPEKLDVDLGACREEARLSPGLRDVMGAVYDQLRWNSLLGAWQGNRLNKLLTILYFFEFRG